MAEILLSYRQKSGYDLSKTNSVGFFFLNKFSILFYLSSQGLALIHQVMYWMKIYFIKKFMWAFEEMPLKFIL